MYVAGKKKTVVDVHDLHVILHVHWLAIQTVLSVGSVVF